CHFCSLVSSRQNGSHSRGIETDWASNPGVPKLRSIGRGHPSSLHNADKTVFPFNGSFVAMAPEDQNFGIARYGIWRGASSQGDLGISVCHEVLIYWRHARIGCFVCLCLP